MVGGHAQAALLVEGIHLHHYAVGVVPEIHPVPLQLGHHGDDRLDIRAAARAGIDLEARLVERLHGAPVGGEGIGDGVADGVHEDVQGALGRDAGILLPDGARGGVSRVGEGFLPLGLQRPVQPLEGLVGHVDLAPHLQDVQVRERAAEAERDRPDRLQVLGDVLAHPPVAAGGPPDETSLLVQQGDAQAVHLGLADVREALPGEGALEAGLELADLVGGVGVVQTEHGHAVLDRGEPFGHGPADALGGRVGGDEVRVCRLQLFEFVEEAVIVGVGDLGAVQDVVGVAVMVEEPAELLGAGSRCLSCSHGGSPAVSSNRMRAP
jgi:hypothetical protein